MNKIHVFSALCFVSAASAARTRQTFDFGWQYILGDLGYTPSVSSSDVAVPVTAVTDPGSGFCAFSENITGTQCYGLNAIGDALTIDECAAACCLDYSCYLWQWDSSNNQGSCWTGSTCTQNVSNPDWISFRRSSPPTPPGPPVTQPPCTDSSKPCAPGYDDSTWRTVNTPHDFIVEGAPNPDCDRGHGYLCFNKSWYRKTFTVPSTDQGSLIWLDFDGVYKNSDMWLNGAYLGHFTSGYVSFRYYLHNATFPNSTTPVLNYGSTNNVLSVLVDALTEQEGVSF